jgi:hypothetical protein
VVYDHVANSGGAWGDTDLLGMVIIPAIGVVPFLIGRALRYILAGR